MSRPARPLRTLALLLPPIVVAGTLAFVVARGASTGAQEAEERAIRGRWDSPADPESLVRDVEAYLARHGSDPDARWFAAEAFARGRRVLRAYEAVFTDPATARDPAAPRRFARIVLPILGRVPGIPDARSPLHPRVLQARLEAMEPGADAEAIATVRRMELREIAAYYKLFQRTPSRGAEVFAAALLGRTPEREFRVAGAMMPPGPPPKEHVDLLLDVLASTWRFERLPTWQQVVRALGASGDVRALEALRAARAKVSDDTPQAERLRLILDVGLALADDVPAVERLRDLSGADDATRTWVSSLLGVGLTGRWARGDGGVIPRLVALWTASPPGSLTRLEIGAATLLADPPHAAPGLPRDRFAEDFASSDSILERTIAHAYAYRLGRAGAGTALVADLGAALRTARLGPTDDALDTDSAAAMEVLRAFLRGSR